MAGRMRSGIAAAVRWCVVLLKSASGWPHGCCRFHPTCSEYARRVILEQQPLRAAGLIAVRLVRCGPWSAGGYDPPPGGGAGARATDGKCSYE